MADIETITGNSGGAVGPDGSQNINILGSAPITITGNPGTFTLTVSHDGSLAETYTCDTGSASPSGTNINVFGTAAQGISTSGAGDTVTITAADATTTQKGVLETSTDAESIAGTSTSVAVTPESLKAKLGVQTQYTVPYGAGDSSAFSWTAAATNGQVIIGATGAAPAFASITSTDASITITAGANTLDLAAGATTATTYTTDSGNAIPAANVLNVLGGTGCGTTGAGSTVTINVDSTVALSYPTDSGTAIPAANALSILGGTGCATSGAAAVVTIDLDASVPLSFPTDAGTATPAANALTVAGGTLLNTAGAGATLTVNADDNVVGSVASDSGTVTPSSNSFTVTGTGGITTSGSGATLTIDGSAISDFDWTDVTGTSQAMAINNGYSANNAGLVTLTLPSSAVFGSRVRVAGYGAGGWKIAQNAGQTIHFNSSNTTTGAGGSISSTNRYNAIELLCSVATTDWVVLSSSGNFTIV